MAARFGAAIKNSANLFDRLVFAINYLGEAASDCPVVIDFGETEVFERQVAKSGHGVVDGFFSTTYVVEKLAKGCFVHCMDSVGRDRRFGKR